MKTIFEFLKRTLAGQNQFASGGLLLMMVGAIGVYLRSLPSRLWTWAIYQTTMMLTITDDDAAFDWIKEWFLEQKFLKRVRCLDLDTSLRGEDAALVPAPGMKPQRRRPLNSSNRISLKLWRSFKACCWA